MYSQLFLFILLVFVLDANAQQELNENYYRMQGNGYLESHTCAIADQMKFFVDDARRSRFPGHMQS
jgi:hypothetical protein